MNFYLYCKEYVKKMAADRREAKKKGQRPWKHPARYTHLFYGLLKGRTMEQIENKHHENNEPQGYYIKQTFLRLADDYRQDTGQEPEIPDYLKEYAWFPKETASTS